jgi:hypothetical protein
VPLIVPDDESDRLERASQETGQLVSRLLDE